MALMHLIVPFAAPSSEAGRQALRDLSLPRLASMLRQLQAQPEDRADEWSLSPPHERALSRALGLQEVPDGQVPMAAWLALRHGWAGPGRTQGWGLLTPGHWKLGTEQLSLLDPALLDLDEAQSRAFLAAVSELFTSEGFELHFLEPTVWLCRHDQLEGLPSASLDRVIGRNVDRWLQADPRARRVRRLQNEVQMLLHGHALNQAREERGELPLNSVWLSGTGVTPAQPWPSDDPVLTPALRGAALNEDWARWAEAWRELDADGLAPLEAALRGAGPLCLTLCGEQASVTWQRDAPGGLRQLGRQLSRAWHRPDPLALLETL
jgi:hypothetical protein